MFDSRVFRIQYKVARNGNSDIKVCYRNKEKVTSSLAVADDQWIKILTWHVLIRESSQLSFVYVPLHFLDLDNSSRMTI